MKIWSPSPQKQSSHPPPQQSADMNMSQLSILGLGDTIVYREVPGLLLFHTKLEPKEAWSPDRNPEEKEKKENISICIYILITQFTILGLKVHSLQSPSFFILK